MQSVTDASKDSKLASINVNQHEKNACFSSHKLTLPEVADLHLKCSSSMELAAAGKLTLVCGCFVS